MQTLESLRATINSIEDLRAVVRTMKALAMVNIRQYEKARTSLSDYNHTVELGLQALLHHRRFSETSMRRLPLTSHPPNHGWVGVILFGSDRGLCGQFNEQIVTYALEELDQRKIQPHQRLVAAVGARLVPYLEKAKQPIQMPFSLPSSLAGTTRLIQDLVSAIEQWRFRQNRDQRAAMLGEMPEVPMSQVEQILLFYNRSVSTTSYQPSTLQLLPLDRTWLQQLEQRPWHSSATPMFSLNWDALFSALTRQYLFVSLYRATVESLASENAGRLLSMQAAEKNIEERLADLNADYRQQRQNSITGELLDIISGFEVLKQLRR
ncbi:F0F1 ATP synthase subunit gamma [Trichothermofontia sp.]